MTDEPRQLPDAIDFLVRIAMEEADRYAGGEIIADFVRGKLRDEVRGRVASLVRGKVRSAADETVHFNRDEARAIGRAAARAALGIDVLN